MTGWNVITTNNPVIEQISYNNDYFMADLTKIRTTHLIFKIIMCYIRYKDKNRILEPNFFIRSVFDLKNKLLIHFCLFYEYIPDEPMSLAIGYICLARMIVSMVKPFYRTITFAGRRQSTI